jgi:hypothetical protein
MLLIEQQRTANDVYLAILISPVTTLHLELVPVACVKAIELRTAVGVEE